MKTWPSEYVRLGIAASRVHRKLRDLANTTVVFETHPTLSQTLLKLAGELSRGLKPREYRPRESEE